MSTNSLYSLLRWIYLNSNRSNTWMYQNWNACTRNVCLMSANVHCLGKSIRMVFIPLEDLSRTWRLVDWISYNNAFISRIFNTLIMKNVCRSVPYSADGFYRVVVDATAATITAAAECNITSANICVCILYALLPADWITPDNYFI